MKKLFFLALVLIFCKSAFATIITVSNDPSRPAQHTTLANAVNAAQPGDTLYVYSSETNYDDLIINKSLTVFGSGVNTRKSNHPRTKVNRLIISVNNVTVDGIHFVDNTGTENEVRNNSGVLQQITLRNCFFSKDLFFNQPTTSGMSDILIENCAFLGNNSDLRFFVNNAVPSYGNASNIIVKNSLIWKMYRAKNVSFINCQLGGRQPYTGSSGFSAMQGCSFSNCIFVGVTLNTGNNGNNLFNENLQFYNCLTFNISSNAAASLNDATANWVATGTISNTSPLYSGGFIQNDNAILNINFNPALSAASPALNAGTDGTDIGPTGGLQPFDAAYEPNALPVIRDLHLQNAVVPANGTLNISLKASKAL